MKSIVLKHKTTGITGELVLTGNIARTNGIKGLISIVTSNGMTLTAPESQFSPK